MTRYILIVLCLWLSLRGTKAQGQCNIDSLINRITQVLDDKKIKAYGYTMHYCLGSYSIDTIAGTPCGCKTFNYQLYVFMKLHNTVYLKKYDSCGEFLPIQISEGNFFEYYKDHAKTINAEEVKNVRSVDTDESADTIRTISKPDHSCLRKLMINIKGKQLEKSFNLEDLSAVDNLCFERNMKLKLVTWSNKTDEIINQLNSEKRFIRKM